MDRKKAEILYIKYNGKNIIIDFCTAGADCFNDLWNDNLHIVIVDLEDLQDSKFDYVDTNLENDLKEFLK